MTDELLRAAQLLRNAKLIAGDFEESLALVGPGDFVYLDPPYSVADRNRGEYGYGAFTDHDLDRLARALIEVHKRGANFVLSYQYCREVCKLLGRWQQRRIRVPRHVAGFIDKRRNVTELLVSNLPIRQSLAQT